MDPSQIQFLLARIQSLQKHNEELTLRVKHLEQLVNPQRPYQKMTASFVNHMKESRISNSSSQQKRPGWNSKTKIEQFPLKPSSSPPHDKLKTKPPIPKIAKSPQARPSPSDTKSMASEKKIVGGVKISADKGRNAEKGGGFKLHDTDDNSDKRDAQNGAVGGKQVKEEEESKEKAAPNKKGFRFEELIKHNNEIISSMKNSQSLAPPPANLNLVTKAPSPRSEYHLSSTTSPIDRSFASDQSPPAPAATNHQK